MRILAGKGLMLKAGTVGDPEWGLVYPVIGTAGHVSDVHWNVAMYRDNFKVLDKFIEEPSGRSGGDYHPTHPGQGKAPFRVVKQQFGFTRADTKEWPRTRLK